MANNLDTNSMALFCDFENIALGVRDAKYEKFDIKPVLERLLAKGSIVVKKAYCDWDRYKAFKAIMHEANFELIEIPHIRQSGKNSADIRMVVDALDLCYTKSHVDTFVIISGDSDFSPLVSKLRENAKQVIGVGVKQSTSDLLIANCDEFIFYDDLVREREAKRANVRREQQYKRSPEEEKARRIEQETKRTKAVELAAATFDDLIAVRGDAERIWASVLKEAMRRRNPGFNESYYGYKTFSALLDDAAVRNLLDVGRDEKSGTYVTRAANKQATMMPLGEASEALEALKVVVDAVPVCAEVIPFEFVQEQAPSSKLQLKCRTRGGRKSVEKSALLVPTPMAAHVMSVEAVDAPTVEVVRQSESPPVAIPSDPAQAQAMIKKRSERKQSAHAKTQAKVTTMTDSKPKALTRAREKKAETPKSQ